MDVGPYQTLLMQQTGLLFRAAWLQSVLEFARPNGVTSTAMTTDANCRTLLEQIMYQDLARIVERGSLPSESSLVYVRI